LGDAKTHSFILFSLHIVLAIQRSSQQPDPNDHLGGQFGIQKERLVVIGVSLIQLQGAAADVMQASTRQRQQGFIGVQQVKRSVEASLEAVHRRACGSGKDVVLFVAVEERYPAKCQVEVVFA
jgi:hypothetical protein